MGMKICYIYNNQGLVCQPKKIIFFLFCRLQGANFMLRPGGGGNGGLGEGVFGGVDYFFG
jgi:hypothetical protein